MARPEKAGSLLIIIPIMGKRNLSEKEGYSEYISRVPKLFKFPGQPKGLFKRKAETERL